jgi:hypothetical protein
VKAPPRSPADRRLPHRTRRSDVYIGLGTLLLIIILILLFA